MAIQQPQFGTPIPAVHHVTWHALDQMDARCLTADAVRSALCYGRTSWTRGARIYAIGRNEVRRYQQDGVDLSRYEGVHVVESANGTILTVYRNRDLRALRPDKRPRYVALSA